MKNSHTVEAIGDAILDVHTSLSGTATEHRVPRGEITDTDAWALYVEQMSELGLEVEAGVATPDRFYEEARVSSASALRAFRQRSGDAK